MLPYIEILGRQVPTYGLMAGLALALGLAAALARCRRFGLSADDIAYIYVFGALGVAVGAKALYLCTVLPELAGELVWLWRAPRLFFAKYFSGGFVFYGGMLGGLAGAAWSARQYKVRLTDTLPVLVPALALAHSVARIGCFCAGCCYGVPSQRFGIAFSASAAAPNGVPLVPVQLYEAAAELLIFCFLLWFTARPARARYALYAWIFCYAPVRFVLEFWRGDAARGIFAGLSTSQWISLALLAAAAGRLLWLRRQKTT